MEGARIGQPARPLHIMVSSTPKNMDHRNNTQDLSKEVEEAIVLRVVREEEDSGPIVPESRERILDQMRDILVRLREAEGERRA